MYQVDGDYKHYAELIADVMRRYREKHTGSLLFFRPDDRMAQINFDKGEIVFAYYHGKLGQEAINKLPNIGNARIAFYPAQEAVVRISLPPTPAIIDQLTELWAAVKICPVTSKKSRQQLVGRRELIEASLIGYIGPMGGMLCDEVFEKKLPLDSALHLLSSFIPNPNDANRFYLDAKNYD